jgi:hypothetical protein
MTAEAELNGTRCFCGAAKPRMLPFCDRHSRELPRALLEALQAALQAGTCDLLDQPDPHAHLVEIIKGYRAAHGRAKEWLRGVR